MAAPFAAVPVQVAQAAQPQASPKQLDLQKQVESKFDGVLANKAQGPNGAVLHSPAGPYGPQGLRSLQMVKEAQAAEKLRLQKVDAGGQDWGSSLTKSLSKVETDWNSAEGVLKEVFNSKKDLSMRECLQIQAVMQKYTMELDLTGKVVEKAMNGLKDTLKTQV